MVRGVCKSVSTELTVCIRFRILLDPKIRLGHSTIWKDILNIPTGITYHRDTKGLEAEVSFEGAGGRHPQGKRKKERKKEKREKKERKIEGNYEYCQITTYKKLFFFAIFR